MTSLPLNTYSASDDSDMNDDYDFISDPEYTPPTTPRAAASVAVTSLSRKSSPPPKGWSTFDLSDGFSSGEEEGPSSRSGSSSKDGPFNCKSCSKLLRDCVECPSCHSLFCHDHLRVDKTTGKSPCPCEPCCISGAEAASSNDYSPTQIGKNNSSNSNSNSNSNNYNSNERGDTPPVRVHPSDAFLPNIPVQRMADAVPSHCDGCDISLSWGDLGAHACDLQTVSCEFARWGCRWAGRRHNKTDHLTSSTCPGQLAKAEHDTADARAEVLALRAKLAAAIEATEIAEYRAQSAEARSKIFENKCAAAEKCIHLRDDALSAANAKVATAQAEAAAANMKSAEAVRNAEAAKASVAAAAAVTAAAAEARSKLLRSVMKSPGRALTTSSVGEENPQYKNIVSVATSNTATATFGAIFNKATGFSSSGSAPPNNFDLSAPVFAGNNHESLLPSPSPSPSPLQRQLGRKVAFDHPSAAAARRAHVAAAASAASAAAVATTATVTTAATKGPEPSVVVSPATDAACQAPVPATEACLRPYLKRPKALLEKKVVVFWPRQGRWYVGRPTVYRHSTGEHRIEYDDGDVRDHVLSQRSWGLMG